MKMIDEQQASQPEPQQPQEEAQLTEAELGQVAGGDFYVTRTVGGVTTHSVLHVPTTPSKSIVTLSVKSTSQVFTTTHGVSSG